MWGKTNTQAHTAAATASGGHLLNAKRGLFILILVGALSLAGAQLAGGGLTTFWDGDSIMAAVEGTGIGVDLTPEAGGSLNLSTTEATYLALSAVQQTIDGKNSQNISLSQ